MKEKLSTIYDALQELQIKPTAHNTSILNGVFNLLKEIYDEMGDDNGRSASDSDGRDND